MWHGFIRLHDESTEAKALLSHTGPFPLLVMCLILLLRLASLCKLSCPLLLTSKLLLVSLLLLALLPLYPLLLTTLFLQADSKPFFEQPLVPKTIFILVLLDIYWEFMIYAREILA